MPDSARELAQVRQERGACGMRVSLVILVIAVVLIINLLVVATALAPTSRVQESVSDSETTDEAEPVMEVQHLREQPALPSRGSERWLVMEATAYTAGPESTGKKPGDPAYGVTKSSTRARLGVVVVDPDLIPLGTWLWIEGMGYFRAEDTGRLIKGYRIDIYMDNHEEAVKFGRRHVRVEVVER